MKLCVGMPIVETLPGEVFGHHLVTFVEAINHMRKEYQVETMTCTPVGLCPHDFARHTVVEQALKQGCTHLFFIDDDTVTPPGGFVKMWKEMQERKCVAISGFYLRRGNPYTSVWCVKKEGKFYQVDADQGVHEISSSGLGCCLIDLAWCDKNLARPWFKMKQNDNYTTITDDCVFFDKIREAGGVILGDADVQCSHIGRREFINRTSAQGLRMAFMALEQTHQVSTVGQYVDETKQLEVAVQG